AVAPAASSERKPPVASSAENQLFDSANAVSDVPDVPDDDSDASERLAIQAVEREEAQAGTGTEAPIPRRSPT
ncbi:MAG: hypothetical protein ACYSVY_06065, partial [Planctomycetota bacterium]